jgi:predicted enzyme related to lactoylglutathione lyase
MTERKQIPGKFVWFELVTRDAKKAQAFYGEVLGWKVLPFPMGKGTYEMIQVGDAMVGGYAEPKNDTQGSHWLSYVSVEDVDAVAKAAIANGGKVIEEPYDIPSVGRTARIADPQGAELCPFHSSAGNDPDTIPPNGGFLWNELHTTDAAKALQFYEKVFGFSHRAMPMGPEGTYYILSKGGVDRGGAFTEVPKGAKAFWLPYVNVDDADATAARARRLGAKMFVGPEDIPGVGRFAVFQDPTGASLAIMKPMPREKQG